MAGCNSFLFFQTSVQVPSPASGVIEELLIADGGRVEGGTPLFKLRKGGQELDIIMLRLKTKTKKGIERFRSERLI